MTAKISNKKKRIIGNTILVLAVAGILLSGIMIIGHYRGWFDRDSHIVAGDVKGLVNITRDGISYSLLEGTPVSDGDKIETKKSSEINLLIGDENGVFINENTEVEIEDENRVKISLIKGELFVDSQKSPVRIVTKDTEICLDEGLSGITSYDGAVTVYCYSGGGSITVDGYKTDIEEGITYHACFDGSKWSLNSAELTVTSVSTIQLQKLLTYENGACCFDTESMDVECKRRDIESIVAVDERNKDTEEAIEEKNKEKESLESSGASSHGKTNSTEVVSDSGYTVDDAPEGIGKTEEVKEDDNKKNEASPKQEPKEDKKYCTVTIRCDTILNNMESLTPGKEAYVPSSGYILGTSTIEIEDGDTAFDATKKACELAGIQLEYSYTPLYGSYYVEGINYLYEFDCGSESGWMYKVNGWFPNYGCSSYTLKDGDNIVWCYTCSGLGADVGGSVY